MAAACGSSSGPPSVYNTWIFQNGDTANGITFKTNHTYVSTLLVAVSASDIEAQVETGTFTASGSTLTFTPTEWSCAEPADPPYKATFTENGDLLEIAFTSGLISYAVDTTAASSIGITYGCFTESGAFVASPLAAVGSCTADGSACSSSDSCCLGSACVNVSGGLCAATCTTDTDCASGCCTATGSVPCSQGPFGMCGYCGPSSACPG